MKGNDFLAQRGKYVYPTWSFLMGASTSTWTFTINNIVDATKRSYYDLYTNVNALFPKFIQIELTSIGYEVATAPNDPVFCVIYYDTTVFTPMTLPITLVGRPCVVVSMCPITNGNKLYNGINNLSALFKILNPTLAYSTAFEISLVVLSALTPTKQPFMWMLATFDYTEYI